MAAKSHEKQENAAYEKSSATLLSQQPDVIDQKKPPSSEVKDWNILRGHLEARLVNLRQWRSSWWNSNWSQLAQYIEPRRSTWLTQNTGGYPSPNNMSRGKPINNSIVDPTATFAVRVCAGGLMSGLASPSRPWFKVVLGQKNVEIDAAGQQWLDEVEERMYTVLAGSNFYNSFAQECEDLVVFGTAPVIIYEDETDLLRCYNPTVGEYYLSSSATMRVDGLYRTFVMTVAQIVDFFKLENCPEDIRKLWMQKGSALDMERIVAHSIEPNFEIGADGKGKVPGNYTWRETYWLFGANAEKPLSLRGFMDQPFTAARWSTQSNDAYGRSPGMDVLPDVIQLQVETLRKAEGIEKHVRPPLVADMQLKNQPSSILPGHVTYVNNLGPGTGMRPIYEVQPDLNAITMDLKEIQARIQRGLFNDLFLMLNSTPDKRQTAYEVSAKLQEKLAVLGPVIDGLLNESLKPRLKRVFGIMLRKGIIPPMPDSLKNVPIDLQFVSMLALAQKAAATGGIERILALVGNMAGAFPQAGDILNVDETIREMNELLGNPQKILNPQDKVDQMRQQRAEQQKAAANSAIGGQDMKSLQTGAQAAQVLSQTQIGGGQTALSAALGNNRLN